MKSLKTEIKYAVVSAIALITWVMTEHLLGVNTTKMEIAEYTHPLIVIPILMILFFGIREKKNKELNGQLTFMQGLKTAFYISLFYALFQAIWFALYSHIINPDYAALSLQFKEKQLTAAGKTAQQIAHELATTKMFFGNALLEFGFLIISTTIIDTVAGAIMTLFQKTKK